MSRELWAKIAVETRRDPKLLCRPEWERLFWVNLILLAKEDSDGGVLREYTPALLRSVLAMKASTAAIESSLQYFESREMITRPNGAISLTNFIKRQGEYDAAAVREKWRERKARQRDKSRDVTAGHNGDARDSHPLEVEEKRREETRSPLTPPSRGAPDSHPFRSRKAKAEPYVPNCARCRKDGHSARECPEPLPEEVPQ